MDRRANSKVKRAIAGPIEQPANITIELSSAGLHIRCSSTGAQGSIPQAIERLKAASVFGLVEQSRPAPFCQVVIDNADRYQESGCWDSKLRITHISPR